MTLVCSRLNAQRFLCTVIKLTWPLEISLTAFLDKLQLASYEYAALEEHHAKLKTRHDDLRELCLAYRDVISGYSSYEEQTIGMEQLRAEAGREGMRAKALEADVLKPIIREAGGLQALVSQMQSIRSLIAKAGGLAELEELVSDTALLQISVDEVGGLQGLHNLIIEAEHLRAEQHAYLAAKAKMEGSEGLIAKAAKYDRLMQVFNELQVKQDYVHPVATAKINPARASRIASTPLEDDPFRDLYEAPPVRQPSKKTGSNDIPLGSTHARLQPPSQAYERPRVKRQLELQTELQDIVAKRPRVDVGRASTLLQRSMTPFLVDRPAQARSRQIPELEQAHSQESEQKTVVKLEECCSTETQSLRPNSRQLSTLPILTPTAKEIALPKSVFVGRYPIALWTGANNPYATESPGEMKKAEHIPKGLGNFLANELSKHITESLTPLWNAMPPNKDTCVLRYLLDGHRPSGNPQERRACRICSSVWVRCHRPCALLLLVDGARTIVFMPLRDGIYKDTDWREKNYWVMNAE